MASSVLNLFRRHPSSCSLSLLPSVYSYLYSVRLKRCNSSIPFPMRNSWTPYADFIWLTFVSTGIIQLRTKAFYPAKPTRTNCAYWSVHISVQRQAGIPLTVYSVWKEILAWVRAIVTLHWTWRSNQMHRHLFDYPPPLPSRCSIIPCNAIVSVWVLRSTCIAANHPRFSLT